MSAPRPKGDRLCLIHGNSLPEGADPIVAEVGARARRLTGL